MRIRLPPVRAPWIIALFCTLLAVGVGSCATSAPAGDLAADAPGSPGVVVEVKPGQTVFDLARESGLSVEEIREVNGLPASAEVAPGDRIFLPAGRARRGAAVVRQLPGTPERVEPEHESGTTLTWPIDGVVLRAFNATKARGGPYDGILVAAPAATTVVAAADGSVAFAGDQGTAFGRFVVVEHAGDLVTVYAHLDEVRVVQGARVRRGETLGTVGTSGRQEAPRLHFQVRRGRSPVDPETLLPE